MEEKNVETTEVLQHFKKKMINTTDSKDVLNYANAFNIVMSAESNQDRVASEMIDREKRTEIEQLKAGTESSLSAERVKIERERLENDKKRIKNEQTLGKDRLEFEKQRAENEVEINKVRAENERERYRSEERTQRYRADRTSKDNKLMAGAYLVGMAVMFGSEVKGILLSKQTRDAAKFIKFRL